MSKLSMVEERISASDKEKENPFEVRQKTQRLNYLREALGDFKRSDEYKRMWDSNPLG